MPQRRAPTARIGGLGYWILDRWLHIVACKISNSQTLRDYLIFDLAVRLGYGNDLSTGGFGLLQLAKSFLDKFKGLSEEESKRMIELEFLTMNDFFRLVKQEFIEMYGEEKYKEYKSAYANTNNDNENNDSTWGAQQGKNLLGLD